MAPGKHCRSKLQTEWLRQRLPPQEQRLSDEQLAELVVDFAAQFPIDGEPAETLFRASSLCARTPMTRFVNEERKLKRASDQSTTRSGVAIGLTPDPVRPGPKPRGTVQPLPFTKVTRKKSLRKAADELRWAAEVDRKALQKAETIERLRAECAAALTQMAEIKARMNQACVVSLAGPVDGIDRDAPKTLFDRAGALINEIAVEQVYANDGECRTQLTDMQSLQRTIATACLPSPWATAYLRSKEYRRVSEGDIASHSPAALMHLSDRRGRKRKQPGSTQTADQLQRQAVRSWKSVTQKMQKTIASIDGKQKLKDAKKLAQQTAALGSTYSQRDNPPVDDFGDDEDRLTPNTLKKHVDLLAWHLASERRQLAKRDPNLDKNSAAFAIMIPAHGAEPFISIVNTGRNHRHLTGENSILGPLFKAGFSAGWEVRGSSSGSSKSRSTLSKNSFSSVPRPQYSPETAFDLPALPRMKKGTKWHVKRTDPRLNANIGRYHHTNKENADPQFWGRL